jgi:hypothetical protein
LIGLLAVQIFLLLSERFQWFAFNEKKGWTVLIAVGVTGLTVLALLLWLAMSSFLRRGFQFNFRFLLLFVVVLSVPLGWFSWQMREGMARLREALPSFASMVGRSATTASVATRANDISWFMTKPPEHAVPPKAD